MSEGLIERSSRKYPLHDAAILRIHQYDADHLLVKLFHIEICLVNSLRIIQLNRQACSVSAPFEIERAGITASACLLEEIDEVL
jgi:hypothetical protein